MSLKNYQVDNLVNSFISEVRKEMKKEEKKENTESRRRKEAERKYRREEIYEELYEETKNECFKDSNQSKMSFLNNIPGLSLEFGKLEGNKIAISMSGEPAFKTKEGNYITISTSEEGVKQRVEVGDLKMDIDFYKVPVQELSKGDIVKLDNELVIVDETSEGTIRFINPLTGNKINKLQRTNLFGMYYYTKIVSLFDMMNGGEQSGLGLNGLNPLTLMLMSGEGKSSFGGDISEMLILSQLAGNGGQGFNPMLFMMLNKGGSDSSDLMKLMMFSQSSGVGNPFANIFGKPAAPSPVVKVATSTPKRKAAKTATTRRRAR